MSLSLYTKLSTPRRETRLVTLLPGQWSDIIECELRVVSLDDQPEYFALSYVWGDPLITDLIHINGATFPVTTNLHLALRRLRLIDKSRVIWVDAICINQEDLSERTQQVNIMGEIYENTVEVLIWIGEGAAPTALESIIWYDDERDHDLLHDYLEDISAGISNSLRNSCAEMADVCGAIAFLRVLADGKHLFEMPFFQMGTEKRLGSTKAWEQAVRGFEILANLPWWNRVWVLQESVLPPKATVFYGNIIAPWAMIVRATSHWVRHIDFCCHTYFDSRPVEERETLVAMRDLINRVEVVRTMRAKGARICLSQLLSMTMNRLSTDSRDRVYALLALVTNWRQRKPIIADYTLSLSHVWRQVVIEEIQGSRSLQILQGIRNESIPNLPSWVMRTSSEHLRNKQEHRIVYSEMHDSCKNALSNVEVSPDFALGVLGHSGMDTVSSVSSHIWGTVEKSTYKALAATIAAWQELTETHYNPELPYTGTLSSWKDAFWRTIAANAVDQQYSNTDGVIKVDGNGFTQNTSRKLTPEDREIYDAWWLQAKALGSWTGPDGALLPERATWAHVDEEKLLLYGLAVHSSTVQRRFFITQKGFMGTGPPETAPGDKIVILFGGDVPFLLRQQDDTDVASNRDDSPSSFESNEDNVFWTLLGDLYVHGIMDGEALDSWEGKNRRYWLR